MYGVGLTISNLGVSHIQIVPKQYSQEDQCLPDLENMEVIAVAFHNCLY